MSLEPEFYRDKENAHRWRIVENENGEIVGASSEGFASKQSATENYNLVVFSAEPYEPDMEILLVAEDDAVAFQHRRGESKGVLEGKQLEPRYLASLGYDEGWTEAVELAEFVMICLSESQGFTRAKNDNLADDGTIKSRDCGVMQINIPASKIGTDEEEKLYDPVYNIHRGRMLWVTRGWQPWYAYTLEVYLRDTYLKKATRGVGNFLAEKMLDRTPTDTLNDGAPYVHKLTNPVLDYTYRVATLAHGMDTVVAKARQLKPIGGPAVDAKSDEIISAAVAAKAITKH